MNIQDLISILPATRDQVDWKTRKSVSFPSINGEDSSISLFSKSDVKEWFDEFEKKYSEKPKLSINNEKIEVLNPKFKELQTKYSNGKLDFLKGVKHTNENQSMKMKKSEAKNFIKEQIMSSLLEKKKSSKKDEEVEDITADDTGESDLPPDDNETTSGTDPNIKTIQTALNKAVEAANSLGDTKLTTQLGNTITYFTRAHVSKTEVSENMSRDKGEALIYSANKIIEEINDILQETDADIVVDRLKEWRDSLKRNG